MKSKKCPHCGGELSREDVDVSEKYAKDRHESMMPMTVAVYGCDSCNFVGYDNTTVVDTIVFEKWRYDRWNVIPFEEMTSDVVAKHREAHGELMKHITTAIDDFYIY